MPTLSTFACSDYIRRRFDTGVVPTSGTVHERHFYLLQTLAPSPPTSARTGVVPTVLASFPGSPDFVVRECREKPSRIPPACKTGHPGIWSVGDLEYKKQLRTNRIIMEIHSVKSVRRVLISRKKTFPIPFGANDF